jgi:pyrimidine-nucleoside phosphorylase
MTPAPAMVELIARKKLGVETKFEELTWLCREYARGEMPDYQVAAWLMAVCWRGMTERETRWLTDALVASGRTLEWPGDRPVVDKHSTGGVGDKTSIILVPLLASAGLTFVKMSGRGLGHTGGTLDKLESIPGFRVDLSLSELRDQVERIGCALVGQNPELVPADGALYALRDVTATVDSTPLIASSVMSKKLAAGARAIVLDVKYGSGAFMADVAAAEELAVAMVGIGESAGRRVRALLSSMDEPLGMNVGNALEVREAIETLQGGGPAELRALTIELGAHLMMLAGTATSLEDASAAAGILLDTGVAAGHLEKLIAAQGGDAGVVQDPSRLPYAPLLRMVESDTDGWVDRVDARSIAAAALMLGAGRKRKGDAVDPRTGVRLLSTSGDLISRGQPIAEVHAASEEAAQTAAGVIRTAIRIVPEARTRRHRPSIVVSR